MIYCPCDAEVKSVVVLVNSRDDPPSSLRPRVAADGFDAPEEHRPTAGPDFEPSAEEQAEAAELLNAEVEPDWEGLAESSAAMDLVCGWTSRA